MPRSITFGNTGPGFARYQLGGREEFTVMAVSFLADVIAGGPGGDDDIWLDYLNPNGQVIYRQLVAELHEPPLFCSLAAGSEPFTSETSPNGFWPQTNGGDFNPFLSERLSPQTLTPGCSVNIYASFGIPSPPTDPMATLDTTYVFTAHLWVEDTNAHFAPIAEPPPLLTHVEA